MIVVCVCLFCLCVRIVCAFVCVFCLCCVYFLSVFVGVICVLLDLFVP